MRIVTCEQMRETERFAIADGISALRLMENAGSAAARFIRENTTVAGKRCVVLCGSGNNGGDGFVTARRLIEAGAKATVILVCGEPRTTDAADMFERMSTLRPVILDVRSKERCNEALKSCDFIVDAVFGTGFHGVPTGAAASLLSEADETDVPVFALDMPSGANAETGEADGVCLKADYTITFGAPKVGQFVFPAADYCGRVAAVDIGIPNSAFEYTDQPLELIDGAIVKALLPQRAKDSNKGSYGKLHAVCGSLGMSGAACLAALGALRGGAGVVTLSVPRSVYVPAASKLTECLVYPFDETPEGSFAFSCLDRLLEFTRSATSMLIGCGISRNSETVTLVHELIKNAACPIILDADGINAFEGHIDLLRASPAELILTPHPGEMARLCGKTTAQIQSSRIETARNFACENGVTLVLKGANTVIAAKDGRVFINPTGNPGMAKGGSGDILAGIMAALSVQGLSPVSAACCAVYIHGRAGDLCAEKLSQYGMIPTDMLTEVPQIFREMSR